MNDANFESNIDKYIGAAAPIHYAARGKHCTICDTPLDEQLAEIHEYQMKPGGVYLTRTWLCSDCHSTIQ